MGKTVSFTLFPQRHFLPLRFLGLVPHLKCSSLPEEIFPSLKVQLRVLCPWLGGWV